MNLFCVGINHRTADVATRERYAARAAAADILREQSCAETVTLATCNRVEVYGASNEEIATGEVVRALGAEADVDGFYRHDGAGCMQHLFRVAAGLDSMVVGETEILGQTKRAYELARETRSAGPLLHRLFQRAFRVAKIVRTKTDITRGTVSVGSVAVDLAVKIFGELRELNVLLIGAGDTSEKTARALHSRGVRQLRVTNRSAERAAELADHFSGRAIPFETWTQQCSDVDIIISSTSAETPLVTRDVVAPIIAARVDRPLFMIDIAVPRDVAPDVNDLDGVYLYDIDSLQSIADQSLALRRDAVAAGEAIIAEHVAAFRDELNRWQAGAASGRCREKLPLTLRVSES